MLHAYQPVQVRAHRGRHIFHGWFTHWISKLCTASVVILLITIYVTITSQWTNRGICDEPVYGLHPSGTWTAQMIEDVHQMNMQMCSSWSLISTENALSGKPDYHQYCFMGLTMGLLHSVKKTNVNILVFSVGEDSKWYHIMNSGFGKTTFLEHSDKWMKTVDQDTLDVRTVRYIGDFKNYYTDDIVELTKFYDSLEDDITNTNWDMIVVNVVDLGLGPDMQSLYATHLFVKKHLKEDPSAVVHVFVDNVDRHGEREYCKKYLAKEPLAVMSGSRLKSKTAYYRLNSSWEHFD